MARGGYKEVEKKLIAKHVARLEELSQSDPSVVVEPPRRIDRHVKWAEGRKDKEGKFISVEAEEIASKIVSIFQLKFNLPNLLFYF